MDSGLAFTRRRRPLCLRFTCCFTGEVVFARLLVVQVHFPGLFKPAEAVGNSARGACDPAADGASGDGQLGPVLFM